MTSIEWLQQQYENCPESFLTADDFEQAKQMHKEEVIEAFKTEKVFYDYSGEQYYNETFKED
jgi:hypothetical protein